MMKRIRGLTFKIFALLFGCFMAGFCFLIKEKYDRYYEELMYNSHEQTELAYYTEYLASKYNQQNTDLEKLQKDIKNAPKTTESMICLLNNQGKLIEKSGFNEDDEYIYLKEYSSYAGPNTSPSISHYFIDVSSLTKIQKELLNDGIENAQEANFYFDGEIEKIDHFYYSSININTIREDYYIVEPKYLHYGQDILGNMIFKYAREARFIGYFHEGKMKENELINDTFSYDDVNKIVDKLVLHHFENVYIHELSYDSQRTDTLFNGLNIHDHQAAKTLIENSQPFSKAKFKKVESYYSYVMNVDTLFNADHKVDGYIVCFYNFERKGTSTIGSELFRDNQELFVIGILLIVAFSYFISYFITRRIKRIDRAALQIAHNHFNVKLDTKGYDELSSLSAHINTMSAQLKRNIEQLHLEIDQVKKMENLRKEFVANFTHEIKTPLAIINGNVDLLEETIDQNKRKQYSDIINKEIKVINDLILQMLDLSKLEAKAITLEKENINIKELSEDIIDEYEQLFKEKKLLICLNGEDAWIYADKKRIAMVIQNYLSNAIKHATYQSTINITITKQRFSIANKGKQMSEEMMKKIWQSFISNHHQGTGLGLAICKNILELHDFHYGADNLGDGVIFYFDWGEINE